MMNESSLNLAALLVKDSRLGEAGGLMVPNRDREAGGHWLNLVADARDPGRPVMEVPGSIAGNTITPAPLATRAVRPARMSVPPPDAPAGPAGDARSLS